MRYPLGAVSISEAAEQWHAVQQSLPHLIQHRDPVAPRTQEGRHPGRQQLRAERRGGCLQQDHLLPSTSHQEHREDSAELPRASTSLQTEDTASHPCQAPASSSSTCVKWTVLPSL